MDLKPPDQLLNPPPTLNLNKRYDTISIPATYGRQHTSPTPGTVAGIILGSVAGFLLLLYVLYLSLSAGRKPSESIVFERSSSHHRHHHDYEYADRRSRSRSHSHGPDVIEVEEEQSTSSQGGYGRRPRSGWRRGREGDDEIVVEESLESRSDVRRGGRGGRADEIVVEEEEDDGTEVSSVRPPRRGGGGRRGQRSGSYRTVDPLAYGGGSDY